MNVESKNSDSNRRHRFSVQVEEEHDEACKVALDVRYSAEVLGDHCSELAKSAVDGRHRIELARGLVGTITAQLAELLYRLGRLDALYPDSLEEQNEQASEGEAVVVEGGSS